MSHDVLYTLQNNTVLVCSGYVVNGSVVSVLISDVDISGTEHSQHPWSSHGEVERSKVSIHGVPWRAWCGNLSTLVEFHAQLVKVDTLMEYHEELVRVDILMEYHEKPVMVDSLLKCHEEFVVYLHTRDDVGNRHIRGSVENLYSANETNG